MAMNGDRGGQPDQSGQPLDPCEASQITVATTEPPPRMLEVRLLPDGNVTLNSHSLDVNTPAGKLLCIDLLTIAIKLVINHKPPALVAPPPGAATRDLRSASGLVLGR